MSTQNSTNGGHSRYLLLEPEFWGFSTGWTEAKRVFRRIAVENIAIALIDQRSKRLIA
jgi:hypothetical protein